MSQQTRDDSADASEKVTLFCPYCDYNLTGLPENRCPECGKPFDPGQLLVNTVLTVPPKPTVLATGIALALPFLVILPIAVVCGHAGKWNSTAVLGGVALQWQLASAAVLAHRSTARRAFDDRRAFSWRTHWQELLRQAGLWLGVQLAGDLVAVCTWAVAQLVWGGD